MKQVLFFPLMSLFKTSFDESGGVSLQMLGYAFAAPRDEKITLEKLKS